MAMGDGLWVIFIFLFISLEDSKKKLFVSEVTVKDLLFNIGKFYSSISIFYLKMEYLKKIQVFILLKIYYKKYRKIIFKKIKNEKKKLF